MFSVGTCLSRDKTPSQEFWRQLGTACLKFCSWYVVIPNFKFLILYCFLSLFCIRLGIILHQTGMGHNHSHGGGSHSHGASHSSHNGKVESVSTNRLTRSGSLSTEKQNINVRAAFIHVLGDIVQSIGVLIAAYIIKFKVKLTFIHACTWLKLASSFRVAKKLISWRKITS